MKNSFIVYKITNNINDKVYIGLTTTSLPKRWNRHHSESKISTKPLYNAINKYGIKNFKIVKLKEYKDFTDMVCGEINYIRQYNSIHPYGYNMTNGGELSKTYLVETKNKISQKLKKWHKNNLNPRSKSVVNLKTQQIWKTAKQCWRDSDLSITYTNFTSKLRGKCGNNTPYRYVGKEGEPIRSIRPARKKVINIKTNQIYNSVLECARINKLKPDYLYPKLNGKCGNDTPYRYLNEIFKSQPYIGRGNNNSNAKKIIDTSINKIYNSIKECAAINNINYSTLKNKINGNKTNNTNFKYYITNP